mmetsp:Transcript_11435/g.29033  ORF Transcript_11435/g.29033 Transcript_11435/m.29033 type:complete len:199 (+) Transcript_11435:269-865(+)
MLKTIAFRSSLSNSKDRKTVSFFLRARAAFRELQHPDVRVCVYAGPYEGGVWKVHVELPEAYPYRSPSIGFVNRIFHPNVDEMAGSVCLDVINQTWSPMFDLINVFEVFLPQLLLYPNPTDPLNGEAAALLMREPENYNKKVKEYVQRYALPEHVGALKNGSAGNQGSDDDDSGFDSDSGNSLMNSDDDDDEIANMDD